MRRCSQRLLYLAGFCLLPFAFCVAQDDLKERRVFVPVEDLDTVIAKDQRGVLLPRDEFLKLYRDAQKNAPVKTTAPVGAVISGATYSAKFDGEQLVVQATIKIRQFADSWQALPLPFGAMAVENAKLNGQPAKLGRNEQTLFLLSDARRAHVDSRTFDAVVGSRSGQNRINRRAAGNRGDVENRSAGGKAFATRRTEH